MYQKLTASEGPMKIALPRRAEAGLFSKVLPGQKGPALSGWQRSRRFSPIHPSRRAGNGSHAKAFQNTFLGRGPANATDCQVGTKALGSPRS